MSRAIGTAVLAWLALGSSAARGDEMEKKALECITRVGGAVTRDLTRPGNPIVAVDLSRRGATAADIEVLAKVETITRLDIRWCGNMSGHAPGGLVHFKNLTHLGVTTHIHDDAVRLTSLPKLTSLQLDLAGGGDEIVERLGEFKNLTFLGLGSTKLSDAGLREVWKLPNLSRVTDVTLPRTATEAGLRGIGKLRELQVFRFYALSDDLAKEVAGLTNLRHLYASGHLLTDAGLKELTALKNLTSLELTQCQRVTSAGFRHLGAFTELRTLNVPWSGMTDEGLKELAGCKHLTSLYIHQAKVTDAGLAELARLTNLADLDLSSSAITDAGLVYLAGLKTLRTLSLSMTKVTDAGMKHLAGLTNLEHLNLFVTAVSPAGVKEFAGLKKLNHLRIGYGKQTDQWLRALREAGVLHALDCAGTATGQRPASPNEVVTFRLNDGVTDEGLKELLIFTNLAELNLPPTVTNEGLRFVVGFKHLTHLITAASAVTDDGLKELAGMPKLRYLHVGGQSKITEAGVKEFKKLAPNCEVHR